MRRHIIGAIVVLVALGAAASGGYWYVKTQKKPVKAAPAEAVVPVRVAKVTADPVSDLLTAVGTLAAHREVKITPASSGHIARLPVEDGALVKKGQVLLVLDTTEEQTVLNDSLARLDIDRRAYERAKLLGAKGFASKSKLESAQAAVLASEATVARDRAAIEHRSVKAPFSGRIDRFLYSRGAYVTPGNTVSTLRDDTTLSITFQIPGTMRDKVRIGNSFEFWAHGHGEKLGDGKVSFISPEIDTLTHSIRLRGEIDNSNRALLPGLFARVALTLDTRPKALTVPENALVRTLSGDVVFIADNGEAKRVVVETGAETDGRVEISTGLKAGQAVITDGRFQVRHGSKIKQTGS